LVTAVAAGTATITYTLNSGCGSPVSSGASVTVNPNVSAGVVTGIATLQVAATATYSSNGTAGGTWSSTAPTIASVNAITGLVTALAAGTTNITYTVSGCGGPQSAFQTLTVNTNIGNPGTVSGTTPLCIGSTATYTSNGTSGGTWSSSNPGVATVNPTTGLVTPLSAGTTNIIYTVTGPASSFQTLNVLATVNAGTVTGSPSPICVSSSVTFSSDGAAGGTWSSSDNAIATVNPVTGLVTAIAPGTANIIYTINAGCGSPASASAPITVAGGAAPVVTGLNNVCSFVGTGATVTYNANSIGATSYNWTLPPNVQLQGGQGTSSITLSFLPGFTTQPNKQIRVTATSVCGVSAQTIYYLSSQLPSKPLPVIASTADVCPSLGTNVPITFTIPKVASASSYIWTAQSGTTVITHPNGTGANDTIVTVTFSSAFTTSAITVRAVNNCGSSSVRSYNILRNNPSTPGLINGPTMVCPYILPNGIPATYSVAAVANASTYTWVVPQGSTAISGQGTNSISFTYPPGFVSGTISVSASNGCGNSGIRNLNISTLSPGTPGIIDQTITSVCPNRIYNYTLASLPSNAASVNWTLSVGTILSGNGTSSITVSFPPTVVNAVITTQAINNCSESGIRTYSVALPACTRLITSSITGTAPTATGKSKSMEDELEVNVYPNPTTTEFKLQVLTAGKEEISVRVLDMTGRFYKQLTVMPYQTINLGAELKAGAYMLEVKQGGVRKVVRVVKF
jgi:uncharacterized protein YjdB